MKNSTFLAIKTSSQTCMYQFNVNLNSGSFKSRFVSNLEKVQVSPSLIFPSLITSVSKPGSDPGKISGSDF